MRCPYCDHGDVDNIFSSWLGEVKRCKECRGVFNRLAVNTDSFYDEKYYETHYNKIVDEQLIKSKKYVELLRKFKHNGSILDYGCGTGVFLQIASASGFTRNVGVDVSKHALRFAKSRLTSQDKLLLSKDVILKEDFDVISFVDSIAHIPDVRTIMGRVLMHNLKNNGIVFIRTPNFSAMYFHYVRVLSVFLPPKYVNALYYLQNRYLVFNRRIMEKFLKGLNLELLYFNTEKDYTNKTATHSLKNALAGFTMKGIPHLLNPNNSMIVIARQIRNEEIYSQT